MTQHLGAGTDSTGSWDGRKEGGERKKEETVEVGGEGEVGGGEGVDGKSPTFIQFSVKNRW